MMPATATASSATQTTTLTSTARPLRREGSHLRPRCCPPCPLRPGRCLARPGSCPPCPGCCLGRPGCCLAHLLRPGSPPPWPASRSSTTGIGSVRCAPTSADSHPAGRCHSSPASRHAPSDRCHTDRPSAPVIAPHVPGPRAGPLRLHGHLPFLGSVPVPEPPGAPGPPSAPGAFPGAGSEPGSGWSSPAVGPGQPGPAASIPPGYPREAGVRPSAVMAPRGVHGETVRPGPPCAESEFSLTDRPMCWLGVNKACVGGRGTRRVSRPTMLAAWGLAPVEICSGVRWCPGSGGFCA